jgi:hypothetical protein
MRGCVTVPHLPWQHAILSAVSRKSEENQDKFIEAELQPLVFTGR